jgi:hypothetical protein
MNPEYLFPSQAWRRLALILVLGLAAPAMAGPGHEGGHDSDEAPLTVTGSAQPRFEAQSDLFEVVGTVNRGELALTLDRYATNDPVTDAQIELESGSHKAAGAARPEPGMYRFEAGPFATPGTYPITLTITAGGEVDLLAADLVVLPAPAASAATDASAPDRRVWWGAGGVAAVLALAFGLRRRRAA